MSLCPKCGIANTPERASCSVCGTRLAAIVTKGPDTRDDLLEPVPPPPKTLPGGVAEPIQPAPSASTTMPGVVAQPHATLPLQSEPVEPPPKTTPGLASTPHEPQQPPNAFKQTMIGIAPGAVEMPVAPQSLGPKGTTSLEPLLPMSPAKPAASKFQTLLGVAPSLQAPLTAAKNEAQQTLVGAGEFSKPEVAVQLPAGSNKGTLIGVAIPGIAPINPGVGKPALPDPMALPPEPLPKPESEPPPPMAAAAFPRRYLALAMTVTAAFFGLLALTAVWWWRATPRLSVVVKTDESGKDSLELDCSNCDDRSQVSLTGATAQFLNHRALLPLKEALHMGDNVVALELARRGARPETIQLKVPVDFRVVGDVTGIEGSTPKLRLLVDKSPNVTFEVEGKPLSFDAAGHGQFELDVTKDVTGQAPNERALRKRISYAATTSSGSVQEAISMQIGIVPLVVDAPGPLLITDRDEFRLCGNTMAGATVDVSGLDIDVDKSGRFCHPMLIKELGRFTIWVTARAKGFAPRKVERTIERSTDLIAYGKKLYKELPHELKAGATGNQNDPGALIAVSGNIVELSENPPITRLLLQLATRRTPDGLVRVVATNQSRYAAGQQLTIFGQITGSLRGPDGRDISEITAAFLVPGLP